MGGAVKSTYARLSGSEKLYGIAGVSVTESVNGTIVCVKPTRLPIAARRAAMVMPGVKFGCTGAAAGAGKTCQSGDDGGGGGTNRPTGPSPRTTMVSRTGSP